MSFRGKSLVIEGQNMTSSTLFPNLPLEIRLKIWKKALPEPRILHITRAQVQSKQSSFGLLRLHAMRSTPKSDELCSVCPASYGGHHPAILSVNRESREEALKHLTKIFGVYWNLKIDVPYFEIHNIKEPGAMLMTEMHGKGLLKPFEKMALDSILWGWEEKTYSMEFTIMHGRQFEEWQSPIHIMNQLPNIKTCVVTYTAHTLQQDLIKPYQTWSLGPVTEESSLDPSWETTLKHIRETVAARKYQLSDHTEDLREDIEIQIMGIHNREREYFAPGKALRPPPPPVNEFNWFG